MAPSTSWFELLLLGIAAFLAWRYPGPTRSATKPVWDSLDWIAGRPLLACVVAAGVPVALRLAILPLLPVPVPFIHDEFSHLLVADTFAHGRLANPTHPLWRHFETFFVVQQPVYASQYPPGSGALMALGQVLSGHPWAGVAAGIALMGAGVCWAAQGWLPGRWALLAGLLAGLRLGVFSYWMNGYWGGALNAAAGALVIGAAGRLLANPGVTPGIALGMGAGAIVLVRPYEGGLLAAFFAAWVIAHWMWHGWMNVWRPLLAAAPFVMAGVALFLGYSYRLTGDALRAPHYLTLEQYGFNQVLPWMRPTSSPEHRHAPMRAYYEQYELENVRKFFDWKSNLTLQAQKLYVMYRAYIGTLLLPAILALFLVWSNTRMRVLLFTTGIYFVCFVPHFVFAPHYAAAATAAIYVLVASSFRSVAARAPERGAAAVSLLPVGLLLSFVYTAATLHSGGGRIYNTFENRIWQGNWQRARIVQELSVGEKKHLLLVRYGPRHDPYEEWVHNGADLENAQVIWARSIGQEEDARLTAYYRDRQIWVVEPEKKAVVLKAYGTGPPLSTGLGSAPDESAQ